MVFIKDVEDAKMARSTKTEKTQKATKAKATPKETVKATPKEAKKPIVSIDTTAAKETFKGCTEGFLKHKKAIAIAIGVALVGWAGYYAFSCQQAAIKNLEGKLTTLTKGEVVKTAEKEAKEDTVALSKTLKEMPAIDKVVEMDVKKLRAFRDKENRVLYMLDNGRFVFVGDMIDVWNKKKIESLEELDYAFNRIDLKALGLEVERTNHITFGGGPKKVVAVVDPYCGWCHRLIQEIRDDPSLSKDYTFEFIIAGFLGQKSRDAAKTLSCSIAPAEAKINALLAGQGAMDKLIKGGTCDETKLKESQLAVNAMGVQSVPFLIAPDGRFNRGKPRDIRAFLEGKDQSAAAPNAPKAQVQERPKVNLEPMKAAKRSSLNIMTAGNGPRMLSVFVDPHCGWCHKAMDEILSDEDMLKKYTVDFVATSILGPASERLNKMVACAKPGKQTLEAFRVGKEGIEALKAPDNCKETKTTVTNKLRQDMGIRSVPVFVTDDGRVQTGKPASIRSFLGLPPKGTK